MTYSYVSDMKARLDAGTQVPEGMQVLEELQETQTVGKGKQETLFEAMSHALVKGIRKSKENGTRLIEQTARKPTQDEERYLTESENDGGGHWKSKRPKSTTNEDDMFQPWLCEETDPFTLRIRNFEFPMRICMPTNVKTYDGSEDPKDHLKLFQTAAKVER
ncbi:hypothetical protein Tco_1195239 [Tanacetum coccineum]